MRDNELTINGVRAVDFIKQAFDLDRGVGQGRFEMHDPTQSALRTIKDWITMAEHDALYEHNRRKGNDG